MTDRADRFVRSEKFGDQSLQALAFKIFAHAAGSMSSRQQQAVEVGGIERIPTQRTLERDIRAQLCVSRASVLAGAQHQTDERHTPQSGNPAPRIEATAVKHQRIAFGRAAVGCGKADPVAAFVQNLPAHGDLAGIRVPGGQGDQDMRHVCVASHCVEGEDHGAILEER